MSDEVPIFPQYQDPPAQNGVPHATRKQASPLFKLAKFMAKPPKMKGKISRSTPNRKTGKKIRFY